jgi:hypothetical protein
MKRPPVDAEVHIVPLLQAVLQHVAGQQAPHHQQLVSLVRGQARHCCRQLLVAVGWTSDELQHSFLQQQ